MCLSTQGPQRATVKKQYFKKPKDEDSRVAIKRPLTDTSEFQTLLSLVRCFDARAAPLPHAPAGSAPCGRTSVPVRLHHSREGAESPSHSAATIWLHL